MTIIVMHCNLQQGAYCQIEAHGIPERLEASYSTMYLLEIFVKYPNFGIIKIKKWHISMELDLHM
jgi:hypothetical protein